MTGSLEGWTADDRRILRRTMRFSIIAVGAVLLLTEAPVAFNLFSNARVSQAMLVVYSIPQALILAVLLGFPLGVLLSVAGRMISRRSAGAVLALTIACSIASVGMLTTLVPAANRAVRKEVAGGRTSPPARNELTFSELREQRDAAVGAGLLDEARNLDVYFHTRWALSCAPLLFVLVGLSVVTRRPVSGLILGGVFCAALVAYYLLSRAGMSAGLEGRLPGIAAAWLPNIVFAVMWAGIESSVILRKVYRAV